MADGVARRLAARLGVRHLERFLFAWLTAQLLTAVEVGVLAAILALSLDRSTGAALAIAVPAGLPLLGIQVYAFYRVFPQAHTLTESSRKALSPGLAAWTGLVSLLGFGLTTPVLTLLVLGLGSTGVALAWTLAGGDASSLGGVRDVPGWMVAIVASLLFGTVAGSALVWSGVLGRLRGSRFSHGVRGALGGLGVTREAWLVAVSGGLLIGWFPAALGALLARSQAYVSLVHSAIPQPDLAATRWVVVSLGEGSAADRVALGVALAVLGPIAAELAFRGFAWKALEGWASPVLILVATTALEVASHLDAVHAPQLALVSLFVGGLRLATGSLLPGLVAHILEDAVGVLVAWHTGGRAIHLGPSFVLLSIALGVSLGAWVTARRNAPRPAAPPA